MQQSNENRVRPNLGRVLGRAAAVLLFAAALCQSGLAYSGPHGRGRWFSRRRRLSWRRVSRRSWRISWRRMARWLRGPPQWSRLRPRQPLVPRLARRAIRLVVGDGLGWTYYPYGSDYY